MALQQKTLELIQTESEMKRKMLDAVSKETKIEKKTKCPVWTKEEPLKKYLPRLKIWNNIQNHKGKYLDLLEALQSSERIKEKDKIELEVQKGIINPEDSDVINAIIERLQEWFGRAKID